MKQNENNPFLSRLLPFFSIGLMIVIFIIGLFIFSYILIFAAIIGFVLFVISAIRAQFSKTKKTHQHQDQFEKTTKGRTIDYNEKEDK